MDQTNEKTFSDYFPSSVPLLGETVRYTDKVVPKHFGRPERQFRHLFSDVFHHHANPELLGNASVTPVAQGGPYRLVQRDDITALFRKEYMSRFFISQTPNESQEDIAENRIEYEEFEELVSPNPIRLNQEKPGSNHLCFVTGTVGQGKSLLLLKLRESILERPARNGLTCVPVYVDLETAWGLKNGSFEDIADRFYEVLYEKIFEACGKTKGLSLSDFKVAEATAPNHGSPIGKIQRLCRWLPSKGFFVLLIIDNTDRFHFAHTQYSFFDEYKDEQLRSIERNIHRLFLDLQSESQLGASSMTVLFVCRREVLGHIHQFHDGTNMQGRPPLEHAFFQVVGVATTEIISKRIALLGAAVARLKKTLSVDDMDRYLKAEKILSEAIAEVGAPEDDSDDRTMSILQFLHDLSHQGLRSFLEFVSRLELDSRDDCEVIERVLAKQPRNLVRLYITNQHKRYRHATGHFPNIFLNDAQAEVDDQHPIAHRPHRQTYWLSYLVLKLIQAQPAGQMTFKELFHVLHRTCGYENHLGRLTVGNLSTPNHYRCIDIEYAGKDVGSRILKLTSRAKLLIGDRKEKDRLKRNAFCFSFDYLQLMIDDPQLRYPEPWARQIAVANVDLGYTLKDRGIYGAESKKYLRAKVPAALTFFRVLRASWDAELQRLGKLSADLLASLTPDFAVAEIELWRGLRMVLKSFEDEGKEMLVEADSTRQRLSTSAEFAGWWQAFAMADVQVEY